MCFARSSFPSHIDGRTPRGAAGFVLQEPSDRVDAQGNATLKPGAANPYSYTAMRAPTPIEDDPERMKELFARNGSVRRVDFDPVTRVAGALAFHTVVDLDSREVLETASMATLFRGYEIILQI